MDVNDIFATLLHKNCIAEESSGVSLAFLLKAGILIRPPEYLPNFHIPSGGNVKSLYKVKVRID